MSIANEITRLQNAKAALKESIEAKGVTVADSAKLDEYPALIDKISGGDSSDSSSGDESGKFAPVSNFYDDYIMIPWSDFDTPEKKDDFYIIKLAEDISYYDKDLNIIDMHGHLNKCCITINDINVIKLYDFNYFGAPVTNDVTRVLAKGFICYDEKSHNTFLIVDNIDDISAYIAAHQDIYLRGTTKIFYIKK